MTAGRSHPRRCGRGETIAARRHSFSRGSGMPRGDGRVERNHQQVDVIALRQNFQHRAGSHGEAIAGQRRNYRADIEQAGFRGHHHRP